MAFSLNTKLNTIRYPHLKMHQLHLVLKVEAILFELMRKQNLEQQLIFHLLIIAQYHCHVFYLEDRNQIKFSY